MVAFSSDPALERLRTSLDAAFGEQIERLVLFGSRARGEAADDSDYDVALFLRGLGNRWPVLLRLAKIEREIADATGADIHVAPFPEGLWRRPESALMSDIRRDGIEL